MCMRRTNIKRGFLVFALLLICAGINAQSLSLDSFTANPSGADVLLSWEIPSEDGVTEFKIYRKIEEESYQFVAAVTADGSRSYVFLDDSIFKDTPQNITYKLQIKKNGVFYTYYTSVVHNPTSVQRTWGSIKAMFRD